MINKINSFLSRFEIAIFIGWVLAVHIFELIMLPSLMIVTEVLAKFTLSQRFVQIWVSTLDIPHYISIANSGYAKESFAFFPVWPLLLRIFSANIIMAKLIAMVLTGLFIIQFIKLIKFWKYGDYSKEIIIAYLAWPFSFLLLSPLTEPLFLVLSSLIFLLVAKKKYLLASLLAGLGSGTRWVGILLILYILVKLWERGWRVLIKHWWTSIVGTGGLLIYGLYLQVYYGNFLIFYQQSNAMWGRTVGNSAWIKLIGEFNDFFSQLVGSFKPVPINILQFGSVFIFIFLLIYAFSKIEFALWLFCFLNMLIPLASGTTMCMPRYLMVAFPLFVPLGKFFKKHTIFYFFYIAFGFMLQAYLLIRFFQFEWVA